MRLAGLLGLLAAALAGATHAQEYPTRPVRVLSAFAPGGGTEVLGRLLCDQLSQAFGQSFFLESKPGGGGNIASELLARSPPDGHTLLINSMVAVAVNPALYRNLSFDPVKDLVPATMLVRFTNVLEVSIKLGIKTLPEFVAYAKANPDRLNHGSPGIATMPHLAAEALKMKLGFSSVHVPYRGTALMAQGVLQGEVQWAFDSPLTALNMVKNNAVNVLAVAGAARDPRFPGIATLQEQGVPDSAWDTGHMLMAPARTPKPVLQRIAAEVAKGFRNEAVAQRLNAAGVDPSPTTPEEAARIIDDARARWSAVVIAARIKVE